MIIICGDIGGLLIMKPFVRELFLAVKQVRFVLQALSGEVFE